MQEGFSKRTGIPIVVIECGLGLQKLEVARDFGRCVQMSSDLDSSKVVVPDCLRDRALSMARNELTYTGFHLCQFKTNERIGTPTFRHKEFKREEDKCVREEDILW